MERRERLPGIAPSERTSLGPVHPDRVRAEAGDCHDCHQLHDRPKVTDMESKATIYDVARAAGVAASTVSRAFARPGRVSAETARRVFAAAAEVGYRSSALPGLTGSRTRSLALVVTDITNPFYSELIRGAHEAAGAAGYMILLSHTREDAQLERDWTERELARSTASCSRARGCRTARSG